MTLILSLAPTVTRFRSEAPIEGLGRQQLGALLLVTWYQLFEPEHKNMLEKHHDVEVRCDAR